MDADVWFRSLTEVAALLRTRAVSPVELTQALLARIDRLDSTLNSYLTVLPERALEQARRAEAEIVAGNYRGALHGVPIAVKDLFDTKGIRTSCASRILWDHLPDRDATVVQRLEAAGAVILGKLNMTEFALMGYHPSLPVPRNPWNLDRTAGGSSSGSGVATAAGLCFASLGTDTGGSIRGPSSWCGVVGLKPTFGRVSRHAVFPLGTSLDHVGPMTRTVADAATVLGVIAGRDQHDPTTLRAPVPNYVAALDGGARGLRVGFDEAYAGLATVADMFAATVEVGRVLERAGAKLVRVELPDTDDACRAWAPICASEALAVHASYFPAKRADYGRSFRSFLDIGAQTSGAEYASAHTHRLEFAGRLAALFEEVDVLLCPGNFSAAAAAEAMLPDMEFSTDFWPFMRYTAPFNMSGSPTLSLPAGFSADGLPLGVQLVGRHLEETTLCRVGHAYERATDWQRRHPSLE
jgi:amidase